MGGIILLGLFAYALASLGIFSHFVLSLISIPLFLVSFFFLVHFLVYESKWARVAFFVSVAVPVFLLFDSDPFFYSGRDQGAIAEAAILLSQSGDLRTTSLISAIFFEIYGAGKALHFPGFHYTLSGELVTQFPIGTTAFFGTFVTIFGIGGLVIASGFLLCFSLFTLFLLVRALSTEYIALGAFLVGCVSFLPLWAARLPLSENLFLFVFLLLSFMLLQFLEHPNRNRYILILLTGALLSTVRIEGIFSFIAAAALLLFSPAGKAFFSKQRSEFLLSSLVLSILFLAFNLATNLPLFRSIFGATMDHLVSSPSGGTDQSPAFLLWPLFASYGLLLPFAFGLLGTVLLVIRKTWSALIPAFLALPAFLFFFDPNITPDHPWMLRRFLFSLWPALMITFPIALDHLFGHSRASVPSRTAIGGFFILIFLLSLPATYSLISFREYDGLTEQTARVASKIRPNDLLLLDREGTGDPYAIPAAPLRLDHDRNAVYFFNPADYEKIPEENFGHIYLLAPERNLKILWNDLPADLVPVDSFRFSFDRLHPTPLSDPTFPGRETVTTESILYRLDPLPLPTSAPPENL